MFSRILQSSLSEAEAHTGGPPVLDNWSEVDYKESLGGALEQSWVAPTWMGKEGRRVQAYLLYRSYFANCSRYYLTPTRDEDGRIEGRDIDDRREYGDVAWLVDTIVAYLVGEDQSIAVQKAEEYEQDDSNDPEVQAAFDRQKELRAWAEDERLQLAVDEVEHDTVIAGDGIYALGWDENKRRPRLKLWDSECYFPVITEFGDDEFPTKVHLAYEIVDDDQPKSGTKIRIRRVTYELIDVTPYSLPWNDKPATKMCVLTDGIWELDATKTTVKDLTGAVTYATQTGADGGAVAIDQLPLGIDFIPVIHIPNTTNRKGHFGKSSLARSLQNIDEIIAADSDLSAASAISGTPMLAFSGTRANGHVKVGPGEALDLGENGTVTVIEAAQALAQLQAIVEALIQRMVTNQRIGDAASGRIQGNEVTSGVELALRFGPLIGLIRGMRRIRAEKYRLMLKMVQRFMVLNGEWAGESDLKADLVFGSFMPSDITAAVEQVTKLLAAHAISIATGVKMLIEAGLPIEDATEEVQRIQEENYEAAVRLLDATGDEQLVAKLLNVNITPSPAPEPLTLTNPTQVPARTVQPGSTQPDPPAPKQPPAQQ